MPVSLPTNEEVATNLLVGWDTYRPSEKRLSNWLPIKTCSTSACCGFNLRLLWDSLQFSPVSLMKISIEGYLGQIPSIEDMVSQESIREVRRLSVRKTPSRPSKNQEYIGPGLRNSTSARSERGHSRLLRRPSLGADECDRTPWS